MHASMSDLKTFVWVFGHCVKLVVSPQYRTFILLRRTFGWYLYILRRDFHNFLSVAFLTGLCLRMVEAPNQSASEFTNFSHVFIIKIHAKF